MVRGTRKLLLLLAAAAALPGLAGGCSTRTIRVKVLRPAAVNLARYRNVAIDDFPGDGGADMSEEISIALNNAINAVTGQKSFTIVERQHLDEVLEELERQRGDLWNQETVSRLGRMIAAAILIHGRVATHAVEENVRVNRYPVGDEGEEILIKTRQATAKVSVYIRASDTETGRVVDEVKYDERVQRETRGVDQEPLPIDHEALLATARDRIVERYVRRILPYEDWTQVVLFHDGDFPQLEVGNNYAELAAWEDAASSYREALDRMTGDWTEVRYKALHNLGVALSYQNQFDEAREAFKEAYAQSQHTATMKELRKLGQREKEYRKLMQQHRTLEAGAG